MNIDWNKVAKNALRSAQKRIDSVLDIAPDEEVEEESISNLNDEVGISDNQWDNVDLEPFYSSTVDHSFQKKGNENSTEDDLGSNTSHDWKPSDVQVDEVVVSEPNPIRDRDNGLFHHSPSNSPDDDFCSGDDNQIVLSSELQQEAIEVEKHSDDGFSQNNRSHDETQTVISSDIEVLRKIDSSSVASGTHSRDTFSIVPEVLSANFFLQMGKVSNKCDECQGGTAEVAQLKMHIQHLERRIVDLQRQNQILQRKTTELMVVKASVRQQSSIEAKLMKKLGEKEAELSSLLQEGEKLAEQNGKLTKELKRLRGLLNEQDLQLKKSNQAEIDRDVARDELRALTNEANKLKSAIKSLEVELSKQKLSDENMIYDLKKKDEKIEKLKWNLQGTELDRKNALEKIQKLEVMNRDLSIRSEEQEYMNKGTEEITKGLHASIEEERKKYENQANYIESLEKRLSELMDSHRNTAEMIAIANAPLYETINRLENDLLTSKELQEKVVSEKLEIISLLTVEKDSLLHRISEMNTECSKMKSKVAESLEENLLLTSKLQNIEKQIKSETEESDEICHVMENLKISLKNKENELERVYMRLREKSDSYEAEINDKQLQINSLISHNGELENELVLLRAKLAEKYDRYDRLHKLSDKHMDSITNEPISQISSNAAQAELADVTMKYDQSMRQISSLQANIVSMEKECNQMRILRKQLKELRIDYENLLEAHGEKIERIEELELDLADVKKLLKDQVKFLLGME